MKFEDINITVNLAHFSDGCGKVAGQATLLKLIAEGKHYSDAEVRERAVKIANALEEALDILGEAQRKYNREAIARLEKLTKE